MLRGPLPVLLALLAVLLVSETRPPGVEVVLGLHAACLSIPLLLATRRLPCLRWDGDLPVAAVFSDSVAQSGVLLFRNIDIIVIGLVLSPVECAIYLIMRSVALWLDLLFRVLARSLRDPLAQSAEYAARTVFVSQAARANLGFLLIGGAGALALFVTLDPVLRLFGIVSAEGRQVLVWLIVAQSAPAIFGATHLFIALARLDALRAWVIWAALPLASILTFATARDGIAALAVTYAVLQIAAAAVCAAVVALRCGIWPGPTALFHRRLKLG